MCVCIYIYICIYRGLYIGAPVFRETTKSSRGRRSRVGLYGAGGTSRAYQVGCSCRTVLPEAQQGEKGDLLPLSQDRRMFCAGETYHPQ